MRDLILDPGIMPQAEGRCSTAEPPRCPCRRQFFKATERFLKKVTGNSHGSAIPLLGRSAGESKTAVHAETRKRECQLLWFIAARAKCGIIAPYYGVLLSQ